MQGHLCCGLSQSWPLKRYRAALSLKPYPSSLPQQGRPRIPTASVCASPHIYYKYIYEPHIYVYILYALRPSVCFAARTRLGHTHPACLAFLAWLVRLRYTPHTDAVCQACPCGGRCSAVRRAGPACVYPTKPPLFCHSLRSRSVPLPPS